MNETETELDWNKKLDKVNENIKKLKIPLIILTALLYLLYNILYVGILPEIKSVAEGISLVFTLTLFFFWVAFFSILFLLPWLLLKYWISEHNIEEKQLYSIFGWSIFILIVGIACCVKWSQEWIVLVTILLSASLHILVKLLTKKVKSIDLIPWFFILFIFHLINLLWVGLSMYGNSDLLSVVVLAFWLIIIAFVNISIYKSAKDILSKLSIALLVLLFIASSLFSLVGKDNPFIFRPFEMLKIGHYQETLYFKVDSIDLYKKELLEDKNVTHAKFCILSNIGSEYIVQKIISNTTIDKFSQSEKCDKNITYRIDKNNLAGFKSIDNNKIIIDKNITNMERQ